MGQVEKFADLVVMAPYRTHSGTGIKMFLCELMCLLIANYPILNNIDIIMAII